MDVVATVMRALLSEPEHTAADVACRLAADVLGVDDIVIAVVRPRRHRHVVAASSEQVVTALDEEFVVGQGPFHDAHTSGSAVTALDLAAEAPHRWPQLASRTSTYGGFTSAAAAPVTARGRTWAVVGTGMCRRRRLTVGTLDDLAAVGRAVLLVVPPPVLLGPGPSGAQREQPGAAGRWARDCVVAQAVGMVCVQTGTGPASAFDLLRARAYSEGATLDETARGVVERRVRLALDCSRTVSSTAAPGRCSRNSGCPTADRLPATHQPCDTRRRMCLPVPLGILL